MKPVAFKKIQSPDRITTQIQDNIEQAINELNRSEILAGRLVQNIVIVSGTPKSVDHRLNRKFKGWIVVEKGAEADIWSSVATSPEKTLILNSSANVTCSLWVF